MSLAGLVNQLLAIPAEKTPQDRREYRELCKMCMTRQRHRSVTDNVLRQYCRECQAEVNKNAYWNKKAEKKPEDF